MGESFGRYELLERLGKGGMAQVHKARYAAAPGINKTVVVKRILADLAGQDDFRQMFSSEAKLTTRLSHGNVVQVFDAGEVNGELFLVMEWVDGVALDQLLQMAHRKGLAGLPPELAALIAIDILKGLHHAHTRIGEDGQPLKLVHRDISPENILVSYEGQVKVTDFGIAKASLAGRLETRPGIFKGKMSYGAPEQLRADPVDARADIYSVGLVLLEMVSGTNPAAQTAVQIATGLAEVPRLDEGFAGPELRDILATATHVKASSRYHNALAFQEALTQWAYPRAGAHAAGGLHHLMAWLFGAELRARGLDATLPETAERWLTTTRTQPAFKDSTAQAPRTLDDVKLPPTDPSTAAAHHTLPDAQAPSFTNPGATLPPQERATDRDRPPAPPPPAAPKNEQTIPPKRRSKLPVTRAVAVAVAMVLVGLAWEVRQRWAQADADDAACDRSDQAYAQRDFVTAQRELQPLLARDPPMPRAVAMSKEISVETPAGEALTQAQKVLEAAARDHVPPDDAKLKPLLERASHTVHFHDEYQALARGYDSATHVSADKLGSALAALDGNNFAEVLRNVPCLLAPCSNDWLKEQLTQERQIRTLLDQTEKLISAHDFKQAEDLLQASSRTLFQAERRKDLMLRLEGDEQAFAALDRKPKPQPVQRQPVEQKQTFRQDQVLLEGAKTAISAKDWSKARSMLHDCLVIAPRQAECARLLQSLP